MKKIEITKLSSISGGYSCFFAIPVLLLSTNPFSAAKAAIKAYICWNS